MPCMLITFLFKYRPISVDQSSAQGTISIQKYYYHMLCVPSRARSARAPPQATGNEMK